MTNNLLKLLCFGGNRSMYAIVDILSMCTPLPVISVSNLGPDSSCALPDPAPAHPLIYFFFKKKNRWQRKKPQSHPFLHPSVALVQHPQFPGSSLKCSEHALCLLHPGQPNLKVRAVKRGPPSLGPLGCFLN